MYQGPERDRGELAYLTVLDRHIRPMAIDGFDTGVRYFFYVPPGDRTFDAELSRGREIREGPGGSPRVQLRLSDDPHRRGWSPIQGRRGRGTHRLGDLARRRARSVDAAELELRESTVERAGLPLMITSFLRSEIRRLLGGARHDLRHSAEWVRQCPAVRDRFYQPHLPVPGESRRVGDVVSLLA